MYEIYLTETSGTDAHPHRVCDLTGAEGPAEASDICTASALAQGRRRGATSPARTSRAREAMTDTTAMSDSEFWGVPALAQAAVPQLGRRVT